MMKPITDVDWQGHRGCRGLMPENSIPAFIHALQYPIRTLELDVVVSKDKQIIVSHEPWFSETIATKPNGTPVTKAEAESLLLYEMTVEEIQQYDCGSRGNAKFPQQRKQAVHKPTLKEMVRVVETYCHDTNRTLPFYNIELKSIPDWYDKRVPPPAEFVALFLEEVNKLGIQDRMTLQSFDVQVLNEAYRQAPDLVLVYLVYNLKPFKKNMKRLHFTPAIYSPYYKLVTPKMVKNVHDKGMKLIPWTVNEVVDMQKMLRLGVDGIITDYPNRIEVLGQ